MACLLLASFTTSAATVPDTDVVMPERHFDILDRHCLDCHDSFTAEAGVNLEELSFSIAESIETAERWSKVLDAINSGEMPPKTKPPIDEKAKLEFLRDLSERMVLARSILSDSGGEITLRRLNRREYANTVEAILGLRPDTSLLPDDRASAEYDTEGASLFFSSDQLEQYLATAKSALELALLSKPPGDSEIRRFEPEDTYVPLYAELAREQLDRADRYYGWLAAGGTDDLAKDFGYLDGWQAERQLNSFHVGYPPLQKWLSAPENRTGAALMITIKNGFTKMKLPQLRAWQPGRYVIRVRAAAYEEDPVRFRYLEFARTDGTNTTRLGWRKVTAPLRKPETIEFEIDHAPGLDATYQIQKRSHMDRGDKNLESDYRKVNKTGTPWGIWVDWYEIEGPLPVDKISEIAWLRDSSPPKDGSESQLARELLERFALEAFRGEQPNPEYLDKLTARFEHHRRQGMKWLDALIEPLAIILSSPTFLYLVESGEGDSETLSDLELANRLAYFLWSAPPDPELLDLARAGKLADPVELRRQTDRLLSDERSDRFVRSFVYQWLEMSRLGMFAFAGRDFPTFDNAVRDAAAEEIYQTFAMLLHERLPLQNLLESDFVVVNDLLADYYGIAGVEGHHWRKVAIGPDSPRGGLLGSAAVSAMGSDGQRSSPVERGVWVLRKLLNDPPPPAPPNVPMLSRLEGEILPVRELQRAHQEDAQCAQCHQKIDPIGYGMENLNPAGLWREMEVITGRKQAVLGEFPIDPAGMFGDEQAFEDFFGLRREIAEEIDSFAYGMSEALISYGLGRHFGFTDHDLAEEMISGAAESQYAIADFVHALIQSETFRSR
ncbi:MAG: DUF1592 domain-containing protein [Verrucomicrobiota bacterium]